MLLVAAIFEGALGTKTDSEIQKPTIRFVSLRVSAAGTTESFDDQTVLRRLLARFGASCFGYGNPGGFVVLGGVIGDHLLDQQDEILICSVEGQECRITRRLVGKDTGTMPRPLLTGNSAILTSEGQLVVAGGGATCFSMGTFWNKGVYTFVLPGYGEAQRESLEIPHWVHERTVEIIPGERNSPRTLAAPGNGGQSPGLAVKSIPRVKLESPEDFAKLVREGKPVVLEGLDLGPRVANWTMGYLVDKIGKDRKVRVHLNMSIWAIT